MRKENTALAICSEISGAPSEIQIIPMGEHETDKGTFVLDDEGVESVLRDFNSRENDLVIDYEHQTLGGGEAPAAGWIKKLINRGKEGLWAAVEWTGRAKEYLRNREYRYLSPVFLKRASDGRVVRLLGAALTNAPAIDGMVPLVNKGSDMKFNINGKEGKRMTGLLSALGLTAGATEEEALKAIEALKARGLRPASPEVLKELGLGAEASQSEVIGAIAALRQAAEALSAQEAEAEGRKEEISNLRSRISELEARLARAEAGELVAGLMKAGKLTPAQREWAAAYAERDPEGFRVFAAKAPVVIPRGEAVAEAAGAGPAAPGALQRSVNRLLMVSDEAFRKFGETKR